MHTQRLNRALSVSLNQHGDIYRVYAAEGKDRDLKINSYPRIIPSFFGRVSGVALHFGVDR